MNNKSRTAQLIFQSFYCAFGLVGLAGGLGLFERTFFWDFYIYFTNISSYLCLGVMFAELVQTARRKSDGFVSAVPDLKFVSLLGTLLTAIVFNFLLAHSPTRNPLANFRPSSILFHIVLPIMYLADWIFFYEHGKASRLSPLKAMLLPGIYLVYVYIHAWIRHFDASVLNYLQSDPIIYPYYFLNPERVGTGGIVRFCAVGLIIFAAAGLLFLGLDRLLGRMAGKK